MKAKTKLALLTKIRESKSGHSGFTLVELMIVVAVIGILSAVALPQYLKARARADAGAAVGELIGLAKECAVANASKLAESVQSPTGGAAINCSGAGNTITSRTFASGADGVQCLNSSITAASANTKATVTIGSTGTIACAFS